MPRRTFEGRHIIAQAFMKADASGCMDLLNLLTGLEADLFNENNHVKPHPDPRFPGAYQAPFDAAVVIFRPESDGRVIRFLQVVFATENGHGAGAG